MDEEISSPVSMASKFFSLPELLTSSSFPFKSHVVQLIELSSELLFSLSFSTSASLDVGGLSLGLLDAVRIVSNHET